MAWVVFSPHSSVWLWHKIVKKLVNQWRKCYFAEVILTDLVVFNFCTFHLKEKWTTMLSVESRLAVRQRQARVRISAGTPGRFPTEPIAMKKMEFGLSSWMIVWMAIIQKNVCISTQKCVLYREPEYLFPNQKSLRRRTGSSIRR